MGSLFISCLRYSDRLTALCTSRVGHWCCGTVSYLPATITTVQSHSPNSTPRGLKSLVVWKIRMRGRPIRALEQRNNPLVPITELIGDAHFQEYVRNFAHGTCGEPCHEHFSCRWDRSSGADEVEGEVRPGPQSKRFYQQDGFFEVHPRRRALQRRRRALFSDSHPIGEFYNDGRALTTVHDVTCPGKAVVWGRVRDHPAVPTYCGPYSVRILRAGQHQSNGAERNGSRARHIQKLQSPRPSCHGFGGKVLSGDCVGE